MKKYKFKNGNEVPALGFGTWQLTGEECLKSVIVALETGYRHIDTADKYGNHREVGKAIKDSGLNRNELFLTSKVWYSELAPENVKKSVSRFLVELKTTYLDLLLIHWPNKNFSLKRSLEVMNGLKNEGIIRNIGVSNFNEHYLEECLDSGVEIVNNQVEIHPTLAQFDLERFAKEKGILLTAYSPLGRGNDLMLEPLLEIAKKHGKTVPQVILNWLASRGLIIIPKATSLKHITENFKSLDFDLTEEEIERINNLDTGLRLTKPDWSEFEY